MKSNHLTEVEIQEYAIYPDGKEPSIATHVQVCETCQNKIADYQLLFAEIRQSPKPAFAFNLSELVLTKLVSKKSVRQSRLMHLAAACFFAALGVFAYLFRTSLLAMFKGSSVMWILLALISAFVIAVFQLSELYKKHQDQMDILNIY